MTYYFTSLPFCVLETGKLKNGSQLLNSTLLFKAMEPLPRQASTMSTGSTDARAIEETKQQLASLDQEFEEQKKDLETEGVIFRVT